MGEIGKRVIRKLLARLIGAEMVYSHLAAESVAACVAENLAAS